MSATHLKICATVSLGMVLLPGGQFPLEEKLSALASAGFKGIDFYMWDLVPFTERIYNTKLSVREFFDFNFSEEDWKLLLQAGEKVRELCESYGLEIVSAIGLFQAEGWPKGSEQAIQTRKNLQKWSLMLKALGTDTLIVAANTSPSAEKNLDLVAEDLGELADILATTDQRIAFEFMSWSTAAPTWKPAWEIVKKADRPNLGICIDVFHIIAIEWADPTTESGRLEDPNAEEKFNESLKRMTQEIDPAKIYSIQLGDAYKMPSPASPEKSSWPPLLQWAGYRTKPSMGLGFLPADQVTDAILKTGWKGPISIECFDGGRDGKTPPAGSALEQAKFLSESWDKSILGRPDV